MSDPAINLNELKEIMDNDMDLIQDCLADYIQDWPQIYGEIKKAVLEKNSQNLNESAHKLKGILKYLAAQAAADAAFALESAGKGNDLENIDHKLETLEKECQKVTEYIKAFE